MMRFQHDERPVYLRALALMMAALCAFAPLVSFSLSSSCQCSKDSPCSSDGYLCLCCIRGGAAGPGSRSPFSSEHEEQHRSSHAPGLPDSSMSPPVPCYAEIGDCVSTIEIMSQMLPPAAVEQPVFVQEGPGPLIAVIPSDNASACPGFDLPEELPPPAAQAAA